MSQIELSLQTTHEGVDWVRSLLAANGYNEPLSMAQSDCNNDQLEANPSGWAFTLRFHLPYNSAAQTQVETLTKVLSPLHRAGLTTPLEASVLEPQATVANALAQQIGHRFAITAELSDFSNQGQEILLRLQPSLAFGSGFHPATKLVLELLERFVMPEMQTLDLGCGSGILSVAMAKLGATVLALDNDLTAIPATQAAVQLNQVESQVNVVAGSLGQGSELGHWLGGNLADGAISIAPNSTFDLIAANVLGRIHVALAADYGAALRPSAQGGILITAGFTEDYASEVNAALLLAGFELVEQARSQEWVAFAHRRLC